MDSRLDYVLKFINEHPLNPGVTFLNNAQEGVKLSYGKQLQAEYYIESGPRVLSHNQPSKNLIANAYIVKDCVLWSIEEEKKPTQDFISNQTFNFDFLSTIFFHLSRYEEVFATDDKKNEWDTMVESTQFLVRSKIEKIPVVDQIVIQVFEYFAKVAIKVPRKLIITHDIDYIQKYRGQFIFLRKIAGFLYRRKTFNKLGRLIKEYRNVSTGKIKDPYDIFDWLLIHNKNIEKKIYFLVGGNHKVDSPYNLDHTIFKSAVQQAGKRDYEICLHPSYNSWKSSDLLSVEKKKLEAHTGQQIRSSRQHYLHFDLNTTPRILRENHITSDSSLGYNRFVGYRCGTGFSYYLYDFNKETTSTLKETPLVFMDSSCLHESGGNGEKFIEIFNSFFEQNQFNTQITCNFHNSFFDEASYRDIDLKTMYLKLVSENSDQS